MSIARSLDDVSARIAAAERHYGRSRGSVTLLAVSKRKPISDIEAAYAAGQRVFGENHVQEAIAKIEALRAAPGLQWHFIGPIQSNKTRPIAKWFDWVHGVDRLKIAERLSEQRPPDREPLQVCIQVNISSEHTKSGVATYDVATLAHEVSGLPGLRLRGLMAIPRPESGFDAQRAPFAALRRQLESLNESGLQLDTLSMGMTDDMEAAIAEGATIVRIGTAIFGARDD